MTRWFLFTGLLVSLTARAQKFSAADLRLLGQYSTGVFTNQLQKKADSNSLTTTFKVQPIWTKRKDGIWLFTERTDTAHKYEVWHFYMQDDTTVLLQFLSFKSEQQAAQLSKDIKQQTKLYIYNLVTSHGCDLYLKKNKPAYMATSAGKDCLANQADGEYSTRTINFTKNTIGWQENVFDKTDKQVKIESVSFVKQPGH